MDDFTIQKKVLIGKEQTENYNKCDKTEEHQENLA